MTFFSDNDLNLADNLSHQNIFQSNTMATNEIEETCFDQFSEALKQVIPHDDDLLNRAKAYIEKNFLHLTEDEVKYAQQLISSASSNRNRIYIEICQIACKVSVGITKDAISELKKLAEQFKEDYSFPIWTQLHDNFEYMIASQGNLFDAGVQKSNIKRLSEDIVELKKLVAIEQENISIQKSAKNFIKLNNAFQKLICEKKLESKTVRCFWFTLLIILIAIPAFTLLYIFCQRPSLDYLLASKALPIIAIEFLFFYVLRVVHAEYKSLLAQLIQFEIRSAVCQFIEDYRKFAIETPIAKSVDEIDSKNRFNLDKFEALIFSGVAMDPVAVPTAFDGIEQISKLIEAVKKR